MLHSGTAAERKPVSLPDRTTWPTYFSECRRLDALDKPISQPTAEVFASNKSENFGHPTERRVEDWASQGRKNECLEVHQPACRLAKTILDTAFSLVNLSNLRHLQTGFSPNSAANGPAHNGLTLFIVIVVTQSQVPVYLLLNWKGQEASQVHSERFLREPLSGCSVHTGASRVLNTNR